MMRARVGICCDNADAGPNSSITVIDEWTGWEERFFGDRCDALDKALAARPLSALDTVLLALGRGDRRTAGRMAATALLIAGPTMLVLAIVLAMGPGR
jgi:hypothetical protein